MNGSTPESESQSDRSGLPDFMGMERRGDWIDIKYVAVKNNLCGKNDKYGRKEALFSGSVQPISRKQHKRKSDQTQAPVPNLQGTNPSSGRIQPQRDFTTRQTPDGEQKGTE